MKIKKFNEFWFFPKYFDKFKVGDYVVLLDSYNNSEGIKKGFKIGNIYNINYISEYYNQNLVNKKLNNGTPFSLQHNELKNEHIWVSDKDIRKATNDDYIKQDSDKYNI